MKPSSSKCFGVKAKNPEQQEAMNALLDPSVALVILEGVAGSGKSLLSVAAGLSQILDTRLYKEIIFTRAPVSVGSDMGFLPGTEEDKMAPWCGALQDNLGFLIGEDSLTTAQVYSKIKIKAMQYMRGRSLLKKWLIVDEVQNLSGAELKVLLTRAGEDTKVVLLGDITQIDNKKLCDTFNGLTDVINAYRYAPVDYVKYIYLPESERSQLCRWAAEVL